MNILVVGATGGPAACGPSPGPRASGHNAGPPASPGGRARRRRDRAGRRPRPGVPRPCLEGQDAVLSALGHKCWLGPTRILSTGTRNIVEAMAAHGVRRLVCETALGIADAWWQMGVYSTCFVRPVILPFYFWDKVRQEAVIRASDLDWAIVRSGALTNGPRRSRYRHGPRVGHWLWTVRISRADAAAFMLDRLTDDRYLRSAVGVAD